MAINDEYPLYNRDAEMFQGTLEQISNFLHGMLWMRNYDQMLDKKNDEKRKKKEDVFRQRQLIRILKEQAKEELKE